MKQMKQENYDVFVSYRRSAFDTANLMAEKLRHAGYKVFFDVDTLTAGKFNEQLLSVISNCKDFILVLPENALDRCHQTDDWVRKETLCAMQNKKNIVPVMLDGFSWPDPMPEGMEELSNYQAVTAIGHEYFDLAMKRLQGFLVSRPKKPLKRIFAKAGIALAIILVVLGIGYGVLRHISNVTCDGIGTKLTSGMSTMSLLYDECEDVKDELETFYKAIDKASDEEDKADIEEGMRHTIDKHVKELNHLKSAMPAPEFKFNSLESYLLAYRDIDKEDLQGFPMFYESMFKGMDDLYESIYYAMDRHEYSRLNKEDISIHLKTIEYSLNGFYYAYLGSLSQLPKSSRKTHFEMAKKWTHFPNGTPLDLSQEEYEQFQMQEMKRLDEEISRYGTALNYEDQRLEELGQRLDELEEMARSLESND